MNIPRIAICPTHWLRGLAAPVCILFDGAGNIRVSHVSVRTRP